MNILQPSMSRKSLIPEYLHAGKGGTPPRKKEDRGRTKQITGTAAWTMESSYPPSTAQSAHPGSAPQYCPKPGSLPAATARSDQAPDDAAPCPRRRFDLIGSISRSPAISKT